MQFFLNFGCAWDFTTDRKCDEIVVSPVYMLVRTVETCVMEIYI